jgi:hypothetical protein
MSANPVATAVKLLDTYFQRDESFPGLSDLTKGIDDASRMSQYWPLTYLNIDPFSAGYGVAPKHSPIFRKKRFLSLPDALFEQYDCKWIIHCITG